MTRTLCYDKLAEIFERKVVRLTLPARIGAKS